jgi:2-hydroxychromene-2-carboxylate isomerase
LPIFGPPSELAARASVAAALQGLQQPLRRRLMRTSIVADERSVLAVATTVGLDTARLLRDMKSASVQAELDRTRALADVFGFIGTPGLVIGRTVVYGSLTATLLRRIIADEQSMVPLNC